MPRRRIAFIDSTLRDGQETLLGGRLRLDLVLPILRTLDSVGFQSIEAWGGGTFQASLTKLHESPWERLRILKQHIKRTPIQMLLRGRFLVGDRPFSLGFIRRFLKRSSELGVEVVRLIDPLNNFQSLSKVAKCAKDIGLTTQGSVLCSYRDFIPKLHSNILTGVDFSWFDSLGIFDPFGTLSDGGAGELVGMLVDAGVSEPFVHVHGLEGSAVAVGIRSLEKGASVMDTCFSGLEGSRSLPSIESMLRRIEAGHFISDLNIKALAEVSIFFQRLFQEYFAPLPSIMGPVTPLDDALQRFRPTSSSVLIERAPIEDLDENETSSELALMTVELRMHGVIAPLAEVLVRQAIINLRSAKRYQRLTSSFLELIRGGFGRVHVPPDLLKYRDPEPEGPEQKDAFEEREIIPPRRGKVSEDEYLGFTIFSPEWEDMVNARQNSSLRGLRRVVASTLAAMEEGRTQARPAAQVPRVQSPRKKHVLWRDWSLSSQEYALMMRGFIQEPF